MSFQIDKNDTRQVVWGTEKKYFNIEHLQAALSEGSGPRGTGCRWGWSSGHRLCWSRLHVPQEAETLVQKLLAGSEVEQLLWQRGDPAVCVEDALADLQECHSLYQFRDTDVDQHVDLIFTGSTKIACLTSFSKLEDMFLYSKVPFIDKTWLYKLPKLVITLQIFMFSFWGL